MLEISSNFTPEVLRNHNTDSRGVIHKTQQQIERTGEGKYCSVLGSHILLINDNDIYANSVDESVYLGGRFWSDRTF